MSLLPDLLESLASVRALIFDGFFLSFLVTTINQDERHHKHRGTC
jgi:hypothetical protein